MDLASEFRQARLALGQSQAHVATTARMSRGRYAQIERGRAANLTLVELDRVAVVLGLSPSIRVFPSGAPVRDVASATRLQTFTKQVRRPLTYRVEVAPPRFDDRPEYRAWDAVLFGHRERTACELEMRLRDVQAVRRRIELKRRDDPTEHFLLLIADTRTNRRVLAEFETLFRDLPRLRPSTVWSALEAGRHPRTGILLI